MRGKTLLIGGLAAVLVGLLGMSVAGGTDGVSSSGGWPAFSHGRMMGWFNQTDHEAPAPPVLEGAEEYVVVAGDLYFEPSRLTVPAGTAANITLDNRGRVFHDFTISELDFHLNADSGQRSTGGLEGLSPGEYEFECTVPGHAQAGMTGVLIVEDG